METQQRQRKGIVFKTSRYGSLILCIHRETAIEYMATLKRDADGWVQLKVIQKPYSENNITHFVVPNDDLFGRAHISTRSNFKGLAFGENQYGELNMSIQPNSFETYLHELPTDDRGWLTFRVKALKEPIGHITHGFEYLPVSR